jgi:hypothetical protein
MRIGRELRVADSLSDKAELRIPAIPRDGHRLSAHGEGGGAGADELKVGVPAECRCKPLLCICRETETLSTGAYGCSASNIAYRARSSTCAGAICCHVARSGAGAAVGTASRRRERGTTRYPSAGLLVQVHRTTAP